jgi:hypothetical protein
VAGEEPRHRLGKEQPRGVSEGLDPGEIDVGLCLAGAHDTTSPAAA